MRTRRGRFLNLLIISVACLSSWAALRAYGATVVSRVDPDDLVYRPYVPAHIFDEATATTPEAEDPNEPEGYQLDGNDYLGAVSADGIVLNVNGLELEKISGYGVIRFDLTPLNGAEVQALYLKVVIKEDGKYDLRIGSFEAESYSLKMSYPRGGAMQSLELKPNARILFSANFLEAILFAGEDTPGVGVHPSHAVAMESGDTTIFAGAKGSIVLESRPVPGSYTPPANVPNPDGGNQAPVQPPANPATNNPPPAAEVQRVDGQLGGSGLLSCALHQAEPPQVSVLLILFALAYLSLPALARLKNSQKKF